MVKSGLVDMLHEQLPGLKETEIALAVDCLLGQMADAFVQGERIEIRGFGSFSVRHRAPRIARNPKTGETVVVSAKVAIHFKPGKELRDRVNASHL